MRETQKRGIAAVSLSSGVLFCVRRKKNQTETSAIMESNFLIHTQQTEPKLSNDANNNMITDYSMLRVCAHVHLTLLSCYLFHIQKIAEC